MESIIVGVTGASGAVYAQRLLRFLCKREYNIHLAISDAAFLVIRHELSIDLDRHQPDFRKFLGYSADNITYYHNSDIGATIASSRYPICSVASGISNNLIQRAAGITIKERRDIVVVPRETPLSSIHLEAMQRLSSAGACILPAMPGFYHHPQVIEDQVDFVVAKILDVLRIPHTLVPEWHSEELLNIEDR